jgi:hypothetical protein
VETHRERCAAFMLAADTVNSASSWRNRLRSSAFTCAAADLIVRLHDHLCTPLTAGSAAPS